jgi:hypothetical protein
MYLTAAVAFPNFLAFVIGNFYLGGDALNGYVQAGHYFVCAHGGCREVAASVWKYSWWHAVTGIGGIWLVLVEAATFVTTGDIVLRFDKRA